MNDTDILPSLPPLNWVQTIRDPIWGEIPITEVERKIIQTQSFHRLRGIKQLGFAFLAYPGANHTRFEHSIGVMHATDMLLKMVKKDDTHPVVVSATDRQTLRLAALLHDIGHPPFSHAMESLFTYYPDLVSNDLRDFPISFRRFVKSRNIDQTQIFRHEVFTEYIICKVGDIRNVLFQWLQKVLNEKYTQDKSWIKCNANSRIDNIISQLAVGKAVPKHEVFGITPAIPLFRSIMNGDIDADKVDYLMRDNYYCGLPYTNDIDSLRDSLILEEDGLKIDRDALKFVHSLLLARYRLITEVHNEKWDIFATAKSIEILHKKIMSEKKPGLIMELFTQWNDSKLIDYLTEKDSNSILKKILTTQYPLRDLARLEYLETHPSIRACIDILSDPVVHHHIPELQKELRELCGNPHLVVHVQTVKLPEFSMKLVGGGDLLRDSILRGISEESVSSLQLVIYGDRRLRVTPRKQKDAGSNLFPCKSCGSFKECTGNLKDDNKILLAELVVHTYRNIVRECSNNKITIIDFLMLIMERVTKIYQQNNEIYFPIRQNIYQIAQFLLNKVSPGIQILGTLDLENPNMTSSFHQQLRKYEQLGLISYSREIRRLESEDIPNKEVFRFDRRFQLSSHGTMWMNKIRGCFNRMIDEYKEYKESYIRLTKTLDNEEKYLKNVLCNK